jgi:formylglycine-generating enzyme required for sulfatase activity
MPSYAWSRENALVRLAEEKPAIRVQPVGLLLPNDFGLCDMYGNVQEWCQDGVEIDLGPGVDALEARPILASERRRLKGGPVTNAGASFTTDAREAALPTLRFNTVGFRVARTLPRPVVSALP